MASDVMGVVRCECAPPFSAEYTQPWCYSYGTPAAFSQGRSEMLLFDT